MTVCVGMLTCLFRCVTGFRCYLDQTCLIMFIPSTACVLFCRHLLDMQGTKGINNIHPNVFPEVGARKKYSHWPWRLGIQIRGIQNVEELKAWCDRGRILHSTGFQAGFHFWRLGITPSNAQPQRRTALCSCSLQRRVVGHCRKTAYMWWVSSEYHPTITSDLQTAQFCLSLIYAYHLRHPG